MALATTCPRCATSFKVVPDQLKLRRGLVRCGMCQHVFSGIDFLRYIDESARPITGDADGQAAGASIDAPASAPSATRAASLDAQDQAPSRGTSTDEAIATGTWVAEPGATPLEWRPSATASPVPPQATDAQRGIEAASPAGHFDVDVLQIDLDADTDPRIGTHADIDSGSVRGIAVGTDAAMRAADPLSLDQTDASGETGGSPTHAPVLDRIARTDDSIPEPFHGLRTEDGANVGRDGADVADVTGAGPDARTDAHAGADVDADVDIDVDAPTHADADADAVADTGTEADAQSRAVLDADEGADAGGVADADADLAAGAGALGDPAPGPDSTVETRPIGNGAALAGAEKTSRASPHRSAGARHESDTQDGEDAIDFFGTDRRAGGFDSRASVFKLVAAALLALAAMMQAAIVGRDRLAAWFPQLGAPLSAVVGPLGLSVAPPRDLDALTIEAFELRPGDAADVLTMTALLRNHSGHAVRWPAMELSLIDAAGSLAIRKVLHPSEYLTPAGRASEPGIAARAEFTVRVALRARDVEATGYTVNLFYP